MASFVNSAPSSETEDTYLISFRMTPYLLPTPNFFGTDRKWIFTMQMNWKLHN